MEEKTSPAQAALRFLLESAPRGEKARLARFLNVNPAQISHMMYRIQETNGERQEKIADFFRMPRWAFLKLGEDIINGVPVFPYQQDIRDTRPHSLERAAAIFEVVANREYHLDIEGVNLFTGPSIGSWSHPDVARYIEKEIGDTELMQTARNIMDKIKKKLS